MDTKTKFPLYLMLVGDQKKFLNLSEAGQIYDSSFINVEICGDVLMEDGSVRQITKEERGKISEIADEFSSSK
ncbi:MAG: hypothetical protein WCO84_00650 [bacterium]